MHEPLTRPSRQASVVKRLWVTAGPLGQQITKLVTRVTTMSFNMCMPDWRPNFEGLAQDRGEDGKRKSRAVIASAGLADISEGSLTRDGGIITELYGNPVSRTKFDCPDQAPSKGQDLRSPGELSLVTRRESGGTWYASCGQERGV